MEERFIFCFVSTLGYHVQLDFYRQEVIATRKDKKFVLSAAFEKVHAGGNLITIVLYEKEGDQGCFKFQVADRYVDQIQRFL